MTGTETGQCEGLTVMRSWTLKLPEKIWNIRVQERDPLVNIFDVFVKQTAKQVTQKFNLLRSSFIVSIVMFRAYGALQLLSVKHCHLFLQVAVW